MLHVGLRFFFPLLANLELYIALVKKLVQVYFAYRKPRMNFLTNPVLNWASQVALVVRSPPANAGDVRDAGLIPGSGRSPGEGHGNPLQYSCLENPMDRGAWQATVHRVAKSQTGLKQLSTHTHIIKEKMNTQYSGTELKPIKSSWLPSSIWVPDF